MKAHSLCTFVFGLSLYVICQLPGMAQDPANSDHASTPETKPAVQGSQESANIPTHAMSANQSTICGLAHLSRCIHDLSDDEKGLAVSAFQEHPHEAYWIFPLFTATGLALTYDSQAATAVGIDKNRTQLANHISDLGSFYATGAEGAGIYFAGLASKNPKLSETGRLGAEAVLVSGTYTTVFKMAINRQRPLEGNGKGDLWVGGASHWEFDSSFPSDHAASSMALARVIASEYPHWYVAVPAYGFAEAVGISRILANQHFPSDVLIGQALGFYAAGYVLDHHALYRPGARKSFSTELILSVNPIADPKTHSVGASMEIPLGR